LRLQGSKITGQSSSPTGSLQVNLLDGKFGALRPHGDIARQCPPHGNQHQKKTYWSCCASWSVLRRHWRCLGLRLGSPASRASLGAQILLRALGTPVLGATAISGFFQIIQAARQAQQTCCCV